MRLRIPGGSAEKKGECMQSLFKSHWNFTDEHHIPERLWQAPHISPTATLKLQLLFLPIIHCDGEGHISTARGSDWRRGCRITRAIYRAIKKCWGSGYVSTGSNKEVFLLFETLDVAFVAVVFGSVSVFNVVRGKHAARRSKLMLCKLQGGVGFWLFSIVYSLFLFCLNGRLTASRLLWIRN